MFLLTGKDFSYIIWIRTTEITVSIRRKTTILKWNEFMCQNGS